MWDDLIEIVAHSFIDLPGSGKKWIWIFCTLLSIGVAITAWIIWPSAASWALIVSAVIIAFIACLSFRSVNPSDD